MSFFCPNERSVTLRDAERCLKKKRLVMKLSDFDDIRPYAPGEVQPALRELLKDRQFKLLLKSLAPWLPQFITHGALKLAFVGIHTTTDFQYRIMKRVVHYVLKKCSDGCTFVNADANTYDKRYTFVSNHRDIVLDSAILDYQLFEHGSPTTCEIAIGDNLLIYPWIRILVKMNKTFTVRRSLTPKEMMKSSIKMSEYMHFVINEKKENIWIAQREGRAKDSSDHTQESVLKMLALGFEGTHLEALRDLNIVPLTISYEYDPCDYLKAKEFQLKRDNPAYKKSRQDDLDNMKVGIMGYKGRIHYEASPCINSWLDNLEGMQNQDFYQEVARHLDKEIHKHYALFPNNYIALDRLNGNSEMSEHYTEEDVEKFDKYLAGQLAKIDIPNKDEAFLTERLLTMYANPLHNYLEANK